MDIEKTHNIGAVIAELRKSKGWTQLELAEKLNVSDKAVSKWEKDVGTPSIEFFPALAELFDVSIDYLMTGKGQRNEFATISKLELAAKNDDIKLYDELDLGTDAFLFKDECGKSVMDYIFEYRSKKLFMHVTNKATEHGSNYAYNTLEGINYFENFYYMRLLCGDESVINDFMQLDYIDYALNQKSDSKSEYIYFNGNGYYRGSRKFVYSESSMVVAQGKRFLSLPETYNYVPRRIISDRIIDFILYGEINQTVKNSILSIRTDDKECFSALSFPHFVKYALKKADYIMVKTLFETAVNNNAMCLRSTADVRVLIELPKEIFDMLLKVEKYDLIALANKVNIDGYNVDDYAIKINKFNHSKKQSDKDSALQAAIHDGIVCLDELIAINDFELYENTIEKYPISIFEKFYADIRRGEYKSLFQYALKKPSGYIYKQQYYASCIVLDLSKRNVTALADDLQRLINQTDLQQEINAKYLSVFIYKNRLANKKRVNPDDGEASYSNFLKAKNHLFLCEILDKDLRFIKKAAAGATQEELDEALIKMATVYPENYRGIKVLLDRGAKLHMQRVAYDDKGAKTYIDEIDEIGTALFNKKIYDIFGG